MPDVIDALYKRASKEQYADYKAKWDQKYRNVKDGQLTPFYNSDTRGEFLEAQRNIIGRLIQNIGALEERIDRLERQLQPEGEVR